MHTSPHNKVSLILLAILLANGIYLQRTRVLPLPPILLVSPHLSRFDEIRFQKLKLQYMQYKNTSIFFESTQSIRVYVYTCIHVL